MSTDGCLHTKVKRHADGVHRCSACREVFAALASPPSPPSGEPRTELREALSAVLYSAALCAGPDSSDLDNLNELARLLGVGNLHRDLIREAFADELTDALLRASPPSVEARGEAAVSVFTDDGHNEWRLTGTKPLDSLEVRSGKGAGSQWVQVHGYHGSVAVNVERIREWSKLLAAPPQDRVREALTALESEFEAMFGWRVSPDEKGLHNGIPDKHLRDTGLLIAAVRSAITAALSAGGQR